MLTIRRVLSSSQRSPITKLGRVCLLLPILLPLLCRPAIADEEVQVIDESWHVLTLRGISFGMLHSRMEKHGSEPTAIRTTLTTLMTIKRMGISFKMSSRMEFVEDDAGHLLSYRRIADLGGMETVQEGTVREGKMEISTTGEGATTQKTIPWEPEILGPYGERTMLLKSGYKEGFTASYKTFLPDFAVITDATVRVVGKEATLVGADTLTLNKVMLEQSVMPYLKLEAWYDDEGRLFKSHTSFLGG